jgi:hypothetical protein
MEKVFTVDLMIVGCEWAARLRVLRRGVYVAVASADEVGASRGRCGGERFGMGGVEFKPRDLGSDRGYRWRDLHRADEVGVRRLQSSNLEHLRPKLSGLGAHPSKLRAR